MGIGVTVARLTLNQLVQVQILDPQLLAGQRAANRESSSERLGLLSLAPNPSPSTALKKQKPNTYAQLQNNQ